MPRDVLRADLDGTVNLGSYAQEIEEEEVIAYVSPGMIELAFRRGHVADIALRITSRADVETLVGTLNRALRMAKLPVVKAEEAAEGDRTDGR